MKPALGEETSGSISDNKKNKTKVPSLEEYLQQRDYLGALTLLEVIPKGARGDLIIGIACVCGYW